MKEDTHRIPPHKDHNDPERRDRASRSNLWRTLLLLLFLCFGGSQVGARSPKSVEFQLLSGMCSLKRGCRLEGRLIRTSRWLKNKPRSRGESFMAAFRRFTRPRVSFAPVKVTLGSYQRPVFTDHRGYFQLKTPFPKLIPRAFNPHHKGKRLFPYTFSPWRVPMSALLSGLLLWQAEYIPKPGSRYLPTQAQSYAVYPRSRRGISIVSDIDDTLIKTYVTQKRKLLKQFLFRNAEQIPVVPGGLSFLRQVLRSPSNLGGGTLHYLTGSPVAIYDRVRRLFRVRSFPPGALHMKRLTGLYKDPLQHSYLYKLRKLRAILTMYPKRRFLLLGDSGEKDPEVYVQIRKEYPKQVVAIYIRAVPRSTFRKTRCLGMFVFHDYPQAIQHARKAGWIKK